MSDKDKVAMEAAMLTVAQNGFDAGWMAAREAIEAIAANPGINTMTASDALGMCVRVLADVKNLRRSSGG